MAEEKVRRGLLLKTALEILRDAGTKLQPNQVLEEIRSRLVLTPRELSLDNSGVPRYDPAGHHLEGRRHHGRGHRCQVQGREARRVPERRPLPAPRLLHHHRPSCGHLVYARGNATPARHVIRQSGIEILCHAIDLSQPPEQLIGQMSNLAELITAMAAQPRVLGFPLDRGEVVVGREVPPFQA